MFQQPPLENWAIITLESDLQYANKFISNLKDTVTTFNYFTKEPRLILVKTSKEWLQTLKTEITPECQILICIVSDASTVHQIEYLMAVELAVPCQILSTKIIKDAKHALYTVCCRLMFKICAKVGGEPWAVAELPYFS